MGKSVKVLQIATLVTPDGAYGGPIRVAINQTRALREAGHQVELIAGSKGFEQPPPTTFDGTNLRLFPARSVPKLGFSGTFSPGLHRWLAENISSADVVHIHMGRDLVTLPSALLAKKFGVPFVLQTHGMVVPSRHPLAGIIDHALTIPALAAASQTLYLTPEEKDGVKAVCAAVSAMTHLPNGVPISRLPSVTMPRENVEVLFLARLHERKRPLMFVEMARQLHTEFPHARFTLVGPDGGDGAAVVDAIHSMNASAFVTWEGAVAPDETSERIRNCDLYVLPSINEPFPMSVLEALAEGKPVIVTDTCGLAPAVADARAGTVVDESQKALTAAARKFLSDENWRKRAGVNAKSLSETRFSMTNIVTQLERVYVDAADRA